MTMINSWSLLGDSNDHVADILVAGDYRNGFVLINGFYNQNFIYTLQTQ